jgi:hypothetical protein
MTSGPGTPTRDDESETDAAKGTAAHRDHDMRKADLVNGENPDE